MIDVPTPMDSTYDVSSEGPVHRCPRCDRPFATERQRDLHLGEVHADALKGDEVAAFEAAEDEEQDDLWLYHFKAVVGLLVIYMLTGLLYLIVLSG